MGSPQDGFDGKPRGGGEVAGPAALRVVRDGGSSTLRRPQLASISGASQPEAATRGRQVRSYGQLPLSFEANEGQTDERVKFGVGFLP